MTCLSKTELANRAKAWQAIEQGQLEDGTPFYVRRLSGKEYLQLFSDPGGIEGETVNESYYAARMVQLALCDEQGQQLLADNPADLELAGAIPYADLEKIVETAKRHNKLGDSKKKA